MARPKDNLRLDDKHDFALRTDGRNQPEFCSCSWTIYCHTVIGLSIGGQKQEAVLRNVDCNGQLPCLANEPTSMFEPHRVRGAVLQRVDLRMTFSSAVGTQAGPASFGRPPMSTRISVCTIRSKCRLHAARVQMPLEVVGFFQTWRPLVYDFCAPGGWFGSG